MACTTLGEWEQECQYRTTEELQKYLDALNTLKSWPAFNEAFKGYATFVINTIVECELARRERKAKEANAMSDMEKHLCLTRLAAMRVELATGLKHSRAGSVIQLVKTERRFLGNKRRVVKQYIQWLKDRGVIDDQSKLAQLD